VHHAVPRGVVRRLLLLPPEIKRLPEFSLNSGSLF
jgi:hypothetical protein